MFDNLNQNQSQKAVIALAACAILIPVFASAFAYHPPQSKTASSQISLEDAAILESETYREIVMGETREDFETFQNSTDVLVFPGQQAPKPQGRVFYVANGSKGEVISQWNDYVQVHILTGDQANRTGWMWRFDVKYPKFRAPR